MQQQSLSLQILRVLKEFQDALLRQSPNLDQLHQEDQSQHFSSPPQLEEMERNSLGVVFMLYSREDHKVMMVMSDSDPLLDA